MPSPITESSDSVPETRQGFFCSEDGTSIFYQITGKGQPLIFCYGLTCRIEHWKFQTNFFSKQYQTIVFDYRGHHRSSKPSNDRNLTVQWCAKDLLGLIDHLNLSNVVCLGHSMGVPVIADALCLNPEKFLAAVFVCGGVTNPFGHMFNSNRMNSLYQAVSRIYQILPEGVERIWKRFTARNLFSYFITSRFGFNPSRSDAEMIGMYLDGVNRTPMPIFYSLISDYAKINLRESLHQIHSPVLVVAGENDFITPLAIQKDIVKQLPNGELVSIPYGSHNAHIDFPDKVNESIRAFIERVQRAGKK